MRQRTLRYGSGIWPASTSSRSRTCREHIKTLEARMADEAEKSAVAARLRPMAGIVITYERDCREPAVAVC